MDSLHAAFENAIFEALTLYPEHQPEGCTEADICEVGAGLLAGGNCIPFVFLYGRGLALRVRERAEPFASKQWLAAMQEAIIHGYSLLDNQGSPTVSEAARVIE